MTIKEEMLLSNEYGLRVRYLFLKGTNYEIGKALGSIALDRYQIKNTEERSLTIRFFLGDEGIPGSNRILFSDEIRIRLGKNL